MTDNLRRRVRLPSPQTQNTPPSSTPAHRRINVISMAAMKEATDKKPSILSGPRGAFLGIALHLSIATVFLKIAEGWHLLDALYFSVVIATTVGYGDITPINPLSKVFVSVYALLSVALIGGLLQTLVERIADAQSDIASSATNRLLTSSSDSGLTTGENDIILSTRRAAKAAKTRLKATVTLLLGACLSGALLYGKFLQASYIDLLYFLCVSMTTVGLGDIHPVTRIGKAYAAVWLVLTSLGFANILSQYANLRLKEKERDLAENMFSGSLGEKAFNEIDADNDGTLTEAEFLGYMMCKLGKASPDDVSDDLHCNIITCSSVSRISNKRLSYCQWL